MDDTSNFEMDDTSNFDPDLPVLIGDECYHCVPSDMSQVDVVCHGTTPVAPDVDGRDPYEEPKKQVSVQISGQSRLSQTSVNHMTQHFS